MNNTTLTLYTTLLRESLDLRNFKKRSNNISFVVFVSIMFLGFILLDVLYSFIYAQFIKQLNADYISGVFIFIGATALLTLVTSITKVKGIYIGQDYDLLAAMPISKNSIVMAKILVLYTTELLYSICLLLPSTIVFTIFSGSIKIFIIGLVSTFFIPILPLIVAYLLSLVITYISDRFKIGNLISTILYVLFAVGIGLFSFFMSYSQNTNPSMLLDTSNVTKWFNPLSYLLTLSYTTNFAYIALFIGVNLVLLIGISAFLALSYDQIHALVTQHSKKSKNTQIKKEKNHGEFLTYFKLECSKLFRSKLYFVNSIMGVIMCIVSVVAMGIQNNIHAEEIEGTNTGKIFFLLCVVFMVMIDTIQSPALLSINIEGQNFFLYKTAPIDPRKYLLSKILLSFLTMSVGIIGASIAISIIFKLPAIEIILLVLFGFAYVLFSSIFGLVLNLKYPKLDWKNEQEAVKSAKVAILGILLSFVLDIVIAAAIVIPGIFISTTFALLIPLCASILGIIIVLAFLLKNAQKLIDEIE